MEVEQLKYKLPPSRKSYKLTCKHCKKANIYTKDELVEFNHLKCKECGELFQVVLFSDDYDRDENGSLVRKDPKLHMSKKDRRKVRARLA